MASLPSARMSSAENRHSTEVAGLCNVTVGYNSSAAGTRRGKSGEGDGSWCSGRADTAGAFSPTSGAGTIPGSFLGGTACCPKGRTAAGGTMGEQRTPLTLNVTVAVTRRPSHVSTADSSSRRTRQPTVAPSAKAARVGFTGVHHCPATRICPVVQSPQEPCHAPTSVLFGISSVDKPIDKVVIMVCCNVMGPGVRGRTVGGRTKKSVEW